MSALLPSTPANDPVVAGSAFDPRRYEQLLGSDPAAYIQLVRNVAGFGICLVDREGAIRSWNLGARNCTGFATEEAIGRPWSWLFGTGGRLAAEQMLQSVRANGHHRAELKRQHRRDGDRLVEATLDVVRDAAGDYNGFVEIFHDITDRKSREQALLYRATRDTLTGVYNRAHFEDLATQAVERAQRFVEPLSLLQLEVDHFRTIGDTWGAAVGDQALVACARTCEATLRRVDSIGRIGGETFAVLMPQSDREATHEAAHRLLHALAGQRLDSPGGSFGFTVSIGVATLTAAQRDGVALMRAADSALYRAQRGGRNRVEAG